MSSFLKHIFIIINKFAQSIFGRLFSLQVLLTILPVTLIGLLSFYASEQIINQQLIRINISALNQVEKNVSNLIGNVYQFTNLCLLDPEIQKGVKSTNNDNLQQLFERRDVEERIAAYSLSFDQLRTHTLILGSNGSRYMNRHDSSNISLDEIKKNGWYEEILKDKKHLLWFEGNPGFSVSSDTSHMLTFAKTLEDQLSSKDYGIFLFSLEESIFHDLYKNVLDTGSQMYIVDASGKFLSHNRRELTGTTMSPIELNNLSSLLPTDSNVRIYQKGQLITLIKKVPSPDWYVVYSIPEATNFYITSSLKKQIILIASICFLLASILAFLTARFFSIPLVQLTKRVSTYLTSLSHSDQIQTYASEVDFLRFEYEMLIHRLDDTIKHLMTEQEEKRKAEFHALQMQINPHFLYNTLNSIKCLVWTNRIHMIEPTMNALIKLFRQTISHKDEMITLEEEIECIRNYVFIHQVRIDNSIDLLIHIPNELKKCKVPKLLLQPIVENAVFHGLEPKKSKGHITIFCSVKEDTLIIKVEDNGVGMSETNISNLFCDSPIDSEYTCSHIGIKNVHERIRLMYGPQYGIRIQSNLGTGTQVSLHLPAALDKEEVHV